MVDENEVNEIMISADLSISEASVQIEKESRVSDVIELPKIRMTVEDVLEKIHMNIKRVLLFVALCASFFAFSSELLLIIFLPKDIIDEFGISLSQYSWCLFFPTLINLIVTPLWAYIGERIGRRWTLISSLGVCTFFSVLNPWMPSYVLYVLLRTLIGIGAAGLYGVTYIIAIEMFAPKHRARWPNFVYMAGSLGVLYTAVANLLLKSADGMKLAGVSPWRLVSLVATIPLVVTTMLAFLLIEETPAYLLANGKTKEAWDVFRAILSPQQGTLEKVIGVISLNEVDLILRHRDVEIEKPEGNKIQQGISNLKKIYSGIYRRRSIVLCILNVLVSTGYWGFSIFLGPFYEILGYNKDLYLFLTIFMRIPGFLVCWYFIDGSEPWRGRLSSLKIFTGGLAINLILVSIFAAFRSSVAGHFGLTLHFFALPIYGILTIYTPENFPAEMRGPAGYVINLFQFLPGLYTTFLSAIILPSSIINVWLYPLVWGSVFALTFLLTFALKYEVSQKHIEEHQP